MYILNLLLKLQSFLSWIEIIFSKSCSSSNNSFSLSRRSQDDRHTGINNRGSFEMYHTARGFQTETRLRSGRETR